MDTIVAPLAVSPALVVLITPEGVGVPCLQRDYTVPVDLDGLEWLAALARGDTGTIAPSHLDALRQDLVEDGLLVPNGTSPALIASTSALRPPPPPDAFPHALLLETPAVLGIAQDGFEVVGHDGSRLVLLSPTEVVAASVLAARRTRLEAIKAHRQNVGNRALRERPFDELLVKLTAAGLLQHLDPSVPRESTAYGLTGMVMERQFEARHLLVLAVDRRLAADEEAEREREERTGTQRVRVVPVAFNGQPPLSLGLIFAYAKAFENGQLNEEYQFYLDWVLDANRLDRPTERPAVYLFSNYLWSHTHCLSISEEVKRRSPGSITVHGGPDTPKYELDTIDYFRRNPHVDITVRGEGEAAAADILAALAGRVGTSDGPVDFRALHDVPGICFRDGDRIVRTPDRERISDLDTIPSPFLTGLFDAYAEAPRQQVTIETNRGCPYGCTFCDWGSATLSRMRKYSIDRVYAELEWCASNKMMAVGPADSNFGIYQRDVEIAEKIAEMKAIYSYPRMFGVSFAKNSVKHLSHIIKVMVDANIWSFGILSLQTMDTETLSVINRSNIKLAKYEELAGEFRRLNLPLFVDLMVGLPGATTASFQLDLQQCVDREVQVRLPITELLVNSPMNEPSYREKHGIVVDTKPGTGASSLVVATATYTRDDYLHMRHLRLWFLLCENFGILRHVSRHVRQQTGIEEVAFYEGLRQTGMNAPDRWPLVALSTQAVTRFMAPPVSWRRYYDEVGQYLIDELGVPDDSALATVLAAQHHLMPSRDRVYPDTIDLPHDYAAWFRSVLDTKESGHHESWPLHAPALHAFGPGVLRVDDPGRMATMGIGSQIEAHGFGANWELASPIARPFVVGDSRVESILSA